MSRSAVRVTDTAPLGGTRLHGLPRAIRPQDSGFAPPAHARQPPGIPHSPLPAPQGPRLVQTAKAVAQGRLSNTTDLLAGHDCVARGQGVGRTPSGAATQRAVEHVRLSDGFQHRGRAWLEGAVYHRGHPARALCGFARLGSPPSPHGRRLIPVGLDLPPPLLRSPVQVAMTSATRGPSTPGALVLSMGLRGSRRLSRGRWWAHEGNVRCGSLRAVAGILSSAGATGVGLPGSVSSMAPLTV